MNSSIYWDITLLVGLLSDPKDWSDIFLWKAGLLSRATQRYIPVDRTLQRGSCSQRFQSYGYLLCTDSQARIQDQLQQKSTQYQLTDLQIHESTTSDWNVLCSGDIHRPITSKSRSQWSRGLRRELISLALTLGSWFRIPLKAWMSVSAFILCLCCPVCR
jgi:hypothetical protein